MMKRIFATSLLGAALAGLAGCVYDPGYVRSDGYYDGYYGSGYYGGGVYYDTGPYYSRYYSPGYYYGPSIGIGLSYRDYHGRSHWHNRGGRNWNGGGHDGRGRGWSNHGRGGRHDGGHH
jgi:hypothetical protein